MSSPEIATGHLDQAPPQTIETRSDLLRALEEACELEHALLIQYLFAAFSIRTRPEEGVDALQAEYGRGWKRSILRVAREEMMHLGLAANLLAAVGGEALLRRTQLPAPQRYFPHGTQADQYLLFTLRPLSVEAIARFIRFEQPEARDDGFHSEQLVYRTIGELYARIERFIEARDESELFVGRRARQEADNWKNPWFRLEPVTDTVSAVRAIGRIIAEGEGTPSGAADSHYGRFIAIEREMQSVDLDAVIKPVAPNPYLREPPPMGDTAVRITDPDTQKLAALFNRLYYSMVLMLELLYRFPADLEPARGDLRDQIRRLMSGLVRPLGELLTELPAGDGRHCAGPTFEFEESIRLSDDPRSALGIVHERLLEDAASAAGLVRGPLDRRAHLAGNIELLAEGVRVVQHRVGC